MPAARHTGEGTFTRCGHPHNGGLGTQCSPPSGDGGVGHVAGRGRRRQGRAQLMEVLVALKVDEFGQGEAGALHRLCCRARDGEEEAPIRVRDLAVVVPVHDDHTDRMVGDDERDHGQRTKSAGQKRGVDVRTLTPKLFGRFREQRHVLAKDRPLGLQRFRQHTVDRLVGVIAKSSQGSQQPTFAHQRERRRVDVELIAYRGEDGVRHLGRIGCRGQCASHHLHALRCFGGDTSPSLVPRLRACRPELGVALSAKIGDPHG